MHFFRLSNIKAKNMNLHFTALLHTFSKIIISWSRLLLTFLNFQGSLFMLEKYLMYLWNESKQIVKVVTVNIHLSCAGKWFNTFRHIDQASKVIHKYLHLVLYYQGRQKEGCQYLYLVMGPSPAPAWAQPEPVYFLELLGLDPSLPLSNLYRTVCWVCWVLKTQPARRYK